MHYTRDQNTMKRVLLEYNEIGVSKKAMKVKLAQYIERIDCRFQRKEYQYITTKWCYHNTMKGMLPEYGQRSVSRLR